MKIALLGMFLSGLVYGTDVLVVGVEANLAYKDLNYSCSTLPTMTSFTVAAEVEGDTVTHAVVRNEGKEFALTAEELKDFKVYYQKEGQRLWVSQLPLNARVLNWVFFLQHGSFMGCAPKESLKTLVPYGYKFEWVYSEDLNLYYDWNSSKAIFRGQTASGRNYQIELVLRQHQI